MNSSNYNKMIDEVLSGLVRIKGKYSNEKNWDVVNIIGYLQYEIRLLKKDVSLDEFLCSFFGECSINSSSKVSSNNLISNPELSNNQNSNQAGPSNLSPSPNPVQCGTRPSNVKIITTDIPNKGFYKNYYQVMPKIINSFKFKTKSVTIPYSGRVYVAIIPGSDRGKLVEISTCPGGPAISKECSNYDVQASGFHYYINVDTTNYYSCVLDPDTTYYANVISKYRSSDTSYNCGDDPNKSTSRCSFLISAR